MATLPPGQARVLAYWRYYHAKHLRPPTMREVGKALGIASTNGIADHLRRLESKGLMINLGGTRGWMAKR